VLLAVEITSLLRKRISKRLWRATHYLSFPLFILATAHGVTAGTDKDAFLLRAAFIVATGLIGGLVTLRVFDESSQRAPSAL
jgi:hypothetical protein